METKEFLSEIYKGCSEGFLTITMLPERKTLWFKMSEIEKALLLASKYGTKTNTFFGVGLRKKVLKNGFRGSERDILCITTLYVDIDVKSEAHAQTSLPSSVDEATDFLHGLKIKPSIIVNSGNGIHGYWLLDKPFIIETEEDRKHISSIFKGFGRYVNSEAKKRGWKIDSVYDLARILRVPGTINHKLGTGAKCEVVESNGDRHSISDFMQFIHSHEGVASVGNIAQGVEKVLRKCEFIKYCKEHAENLPEPLWHAMITNLAPLKDSKSSIHEFSKSYPKYSFDETERKVQRAIQENKPHTCEYIRENLNFDCGKNCPIKAPIVYGLPSFEERISEIISSDKISADDILSKENLKICAWAKLNLPSEYARLKSKLKGKVNLRDFEKAVRFEGKKKDDSDSQGNLTPLDLKGINLSGAVVPLSWKVSMKSGIQKIVRGTNSDELIGVCICPIVITKRLENFDDETEKIELSFFRDSHWKRLVAPRSSVFNRTSIIKYADSGLPVSSKNAADIVAYLSDYENANLNVIPLVKSISRVGWLDSSSFFPYIKNKDIIFESEHKEAMRIAESMTPTGSFETWLKSAKLLRANLFGRFLLASSFASPMLEILKHRVFFVHIWNDSKSGKTAAIKMAISVWGDPTRLMGSFNATNVGLERMACILKHIPFAIDELQVLNSRKLSVENIIYSLANGFGRLRGSKDGTIQETLSWRNSVITSGEQPMTKENSNDGAMTRVLELYGKPCDNAEFAHQFHLISENNYGFAGRIFVEYLIKDVIKNKNQADKQFEKMCKEIKHKCTENDDYSHLDNIAIVCLGDYYSSISVFEENERDAWNEAVDMGVKISENSKELQLSSTIERAWDFVVSWIASNKNRFSPDSTPCYGKIEANAVYIIPSVLRQALEEDGFNYLKVTRGFKDYGFIETRKDNKGHSKMQVPKMINGIIQKCFCIREVCVRENSEQTNPLN
ncbi:MAG: DUF927 domain-containing protein [Clostridia bacterium]|nr:DUF927 domain-containing protein [Clostridia bacterium]